MMFHKNTSGADVLCGSYLGESGSSKVSHSETVTAVTNTNFRYLKNGSLPFPASHFEGSKAPTSNSSRSRTPSIGRPAKKMRSFTYQNPRKNLAVAQDPSFGIQGSADSDSLPKNTCKYSNPTKR